MTNEREKAQVNGTFTAGTLDIALGQIYENCDGFFQGREYRIVKIEARPEVTGMGTGTVALWAVEWEAEEA